jgi:hypothetical protein
MWLFDDKEKDLITDTTKRVHDRRIRLWRMLQWLGSTPFLSDAFPYSVPASSLFAALKAADHTSCATTTSPDVFLLLSLASAFLRTSRYGDYYSRQRLGNASLPSSVLWRIDLVLYFCIPLLC